MQSSGATTTQSSQQAKEAKPELVLQTGYNQLFGATRVVFSPDGRLLATGTFRSSSIKLWETATSRKLRELATNSTSSNTLSPAIAFSRDNRFVAAAAGDNSVKMWDIGSGREVQTFAGTQGTVMAAMGVVFIGFASDNRLVTVGDSVRVWDVTTGQELRTIEGSVLSAGSFNGTNSGMTLTPDGKQLLLINDAEVKFIDLTSGKEVNRVKLPDDQINSLQLALSADGHVLAAGVVNKHFKFWDLTAKTSKELATTSKDFCQVTISRDGRLLGLSENYTLRIWETGTLRELPVLKIPHGGSFGTYADAFASFSEDGKKIATSGFDTETIIWETETAKQLSKLSGANKHGLQRGV